MENWKKLKLKHNLGEKWKHTGHKIFMLQKMYVKKRLWVWFLATAKMLCKKHQNESRTASLVHPFIYNSVFDNLIPKGNHNLKFDILHSKIIAQRRSTGCELFNIKTMYGRTYKAEQLTSEFRKQTYNKEMKRFIFS